jgi:sodium-independent sulfate anion transporter 11
VPEGTQVFKLHESLLFPNANPRKKSILNTVYTYSFGVTASETLEKDHLWITIGERRILALRAKAGITAAPPMLRAVALDFANVARIDTTGV